MAVRTINLVALPQEMQAIAAALGDGGERAMRRAARRGIGVIQAQIDATLPYVPVDTGLYRRGWMAEDMEGGADLYNPVPHAVFIEEGTRPHAPPLEPLIEWARRKLRGDFRDRGGGGQPTRPRRKRLTLKRAARSITKAASSAAKSAKRTAKSIRSSARRLLSGKRRRRKTERAKALAAARAVAKAQKRAAKAAARAAHVAAKAAHIASMRAAARADHEKKVLALAWRAKKSIEIEGMEARNVMGEAQPMLVRSAEYELDRALTEALKK